MIENNFDLRDRQQKYNLNEERIDMQKKYVEEVKQINENKIENTETEISESKMQVSDLIERVGALEQQRIELSNAIEPLSGIRDKLSQMQVYHGQIQNNLKKFNDEISFFNNNDDCPVCGQVLDYNQDEIYHGELFQLEFHPVFHWYTL